MLNGWDIKQLFFQKALPEWSGRNHVCRKSWGKGYFKTAAVGKWHHGPSGSDSCQLKSRLRGQYFGISLFQWHWLLYSSNIAGQMKSKNSIFPNSDLHDQKFITGSLWNYRSTDPNSTISLISRTKINPTYDLCFTRLSGQHLLVDFMVMCRGDWLWVLRSDFKEIGGKKDTGKHTDRLFPLTMSLVVMEDHGGSAAVCCWNQRRQAIILSKVRVRVPTGRMWKGR